MIEIYGIDRGINRFGLHQLKKRRSEMADECTRANDCGSRTNCDGCSFQHFDKIDGEDPTIDALKDAYFKSCSKKREGISLEKRKGTGGRVALDDVFRKFILEDASKFVPGFPKLEKIKSKDLRASIDIGGKECDFQVKCDGSFSYNDKYIFIEIKGYGDDSNSILSAITAAQFLLVSKDFPKHQYYYLGSGSAVAPNGLTRDDFFKETRKKIAPYVRWAEQKGFITFYGIKDVKKLLEDIKDYCENDQR